MERTLNTCSIGYRRLKQTGQDRLKRTSTNQLSRGRILLLTIAFIRGDGGGNIGGGESSIREKLTVHRFRENCVYVDEISYRR